MNFVRKCFCGDISTHHCMKKKRLRTKNGLALKFITKNYALKTNGLDSDRHKTVNDILMIRYSYHQNHKSMGNYSLNSKTSVEQLNWNGMLHFQNSFQQIYRKYSTKDEKLTNMHTGK